MHPDLIILLEDGRVTSVVSNHHLTYAVMSGPSDKPIREILPTKECEFVGTHRAMLRHLGVPIQATKEFDPAAVVSLASENKFLMNAMGKYGFTVDPSLRALASKPEQQLNGAIIKALRALYNAFIVTDPKLMDQYLTVQTR